MTPVTGVGIHAASEFGNVVPVFGNVVRDTKSETIAMVALLRQPRKINDETPRPTMKLVGADEPREHRLPPVPMGMERRMFPRKEIHARVEGVRLDHTIEARQQPIVSLALRDLSMGGCSALSHIPLKGGERVSLFFPPQGISRGWDAYGRVIRCEPSGFGYRVAVQFDPLPAA